MNRPLKLLMAIALLAGTVVLSEEPRKIKTQVTPDYPELAQKMNLHGTVRLKIYISPDGQVRRVDYQGGHPVLADSAIKAVKNWKYEVAPTESTVQLEIKF